MTSVKKIDNVLDAIQQHNFISRAHVHFRRNTELVAQIFANLNAVPEADVNEEHIGKLLNILRSEHLIHHSLTDITDEIIKGCRKFFINRGFAEKIFTQSCDELKAELVEETRGTCLKCLNVISTLMTDERLDKIIHDFDHSINRNFLWLFFHLSNGYEIIKSNAEWCGALESVVAKYQPPQIDFAKRTQEGFDILFDHDRFVNELEQVAEKYETLPTEWEYRGKLLREGINESVIDFVWEYRTPGDEEGVVMAEVISGAKDAATFNAFIFDQLNKYTNSNLQNLTISEEQSLKISSWITDWVDNIDSGTAQDLVKLIGIHPVKLSDDRLLSLLPYSFLTRNNRSLLRHIYDNISDKKLVVVEIDRILSGNEESLLLFETFAEFIVSEKITELYKHFEKMMFSNVWRSVIMDKILKLCECGVKIIDSFKSKLNDQDRLTYYEMAARRKLLNFYDDAEIIADLHKIYGSVSDADKITAIVLLTKYGDEEGLKLVLNHYKNDLNSFNSEYPSLTSYGDEHVETIRQLFEISHTSSVKLRNPMLEITSTWLDSYAMKSVENRDHIIDYYTELSETNPTIYSDLFRQAKNIRNKYYQKTTSNMSITDAAGLYDRLCHERVYR